MGTLAGLVQAPHTKGQPGRSDAFLGRRSTRLSGVYDQILEASPLTSTPSLGLDHRRDPLECLRQGRWPVSPRPRLVPADAGDCLDPGEATGVVRVHSEGSSVEPSGPSVASGRHWETLAVRGDSEMQRAHEDAELLNDVRSDLSH